MMRRGRGPAARWNAAAEAARRWRLTLPSRTPDAFVEAPRREEREPTLPAARQEGTPKRSDRKAG